MPGTLINQIGSASFSLAPMDGYTDMPFRVVCREHGSAFSFSEFVSADAVCRYVQKTLHQLTFREQERPVIFQLFGNDADILAEAAVILESLKPDGIDINMGCSVKKIFQKGSGVGLMRDPEKVKKIFSKLTKKIQIPVSGKIRLGWSEEEKNYIEIGKILEGEGAWAVFIHGRTRPMAYTGKASWEDMAKLKESLNIPVFGNGDITSLQDARSKINQFGFDGILVGRKAIGNPWIFSDQNLSEVSYEKRLPVILQHLDLNMQMYGESRGVVLFRKHLFKYLKGLPSVSNLKNQLIENKSLNGIKELLNEFEAISGY
ncbi:MAG: tRNA dihydrouridine synthase DusB [Spirochaetia bacterium]|nr:tRNA dihydrouridine synthase DusB [Spirochaetia bacterium]